MHSIQVSTSYYLLYYYRHNHPSPPTQTQLLYLTPTPQSMGRILLITPNLKNDLLLDLQLENWTIELNPPIIITGSAFYSDPASNLSPADSLGAKQRRIQLKQTDPAS